MADRPLRTMLSAGEASGDAYGGALVAQMRALGCPGPYEGVGGPRIAAQGVVLLADSSRWGAISITQALKSYPLAVAGYYRAKRELGRGQPGLFIPIDFGYANIRLAKHAKSKGWKVLYFVPPASWRRDRQGADLPAVTDAISTPFPWSADRLREMGANAHWFGHPIKQLMPKLDDSLRTGQVAVLPGSREHEIQENLPPIAEALRDWPGEVEFALSPSTDRVAFAERWRGLSGRANDRFTQEGAASVLARSRCAVVCSGTATLEAALCRCPMVVVYRVTKAMVFEARLIGFKRPRHIALPNILLDRDSVPELVQDEASTEAIRSWIERLSADSEERSAQLNDFAELDRLLGPDDAVTQTARLALQTMA